jgi:hypothetical protein
MLSRTQSKWGNLRRASHSNFRKRESSLKALQVHQEPLSFLWSQPSTTGQPNHNPVSHPSATPVSSLGPQSRPVGVPTMPLQNGNQAAANSVANFHGQNPQAPQMQQMLANPQFAAVLAHNPAASMMAGSVARPASAAQNHPPSGQMQPPQAGRVPQQVAQPGLVQHPQHAANPQLAAYLHANHHNHTTTPTTRTARRSHNQRNQCNLTRFPSLLALLPCANSKSVTPAEGAILLSSDLQRSRLGWISGPIPTQEPP